MKNEKEMVRRIEELEEIVSMLGDSVMTYRTDIKNLQDGVEYCKGSIGYIRTLLHDFRDFVHCTSKLK